MAIDRQANLLGQQRIDVPHLRAIESAVANDFDLLAGKILGGERPLIVKGFELAIAGAVSNPATSLQLITAGGIILNFKASESGSIYQTPSTRAVEVLNASNTRVSGSFTPSQTNYIGVDLVRAADSTTADMVMFLNADTLAEEGEEVPLARTLDYKIVISATDFSVTAGLAPVAIVVTDANNNVVSIDDARNLAYRLGTGGTVPDRRASFPWPDGRVEDDTDEVFYGGDKGIESLKSWMDAVMTRLWEIGGGWYWYSPTADRNVKITGTGAPFVSNNEYFEWDGTHLHWQGIQVVFDQSGGTPAIWYNEVYNQTGDSNGLTDLVDGDCIYIDIDRTANLTIGGGTAIQAYKTTLAELGAGAVPGTRFVLAYRVGDVIWTNVEGRFPINGFTVESNGVIQGAAGAVNTFDFTDPSGDGGKPLDVTVAGTQATVEWTGVLKPWVTGDSSTYEDPALSTTNWGTGTQPQLLWRDGHTGNSRKNRLFSDASGLWSSSNAYYSIVDDQMKADDVAGSSSMFTCAPTQFSLLFRKASATVLWDNDVILDDVAHWTGSFDISYTLPQEGTGIAGATSLAIPKADCLELGERLTTDGTYQELPLVYAYGPGDLSRIDQGPPIEVTASVAGTNSIEYIVAYRLSGVTVAVSKPVTVNNVALTSNITVSIKAVQGITPVPDAVRLYRTSVISGTVGTQNYVTPGFGAFPISYTDTDPDNSTPSGTNGAAPKPSKSRTLIIGGHDRAGLSAAPLGSRIYSTLWQYALGQGASDYRVVRGMEIVHGARWGSSNTRYTNEGSATDLESRLTVDSEGMRLESSDIASAYSGGSPKDEEFNEFCPNTDEIIQSALMGAKHTRGSLPGDRTSDSFGDEWTIFSEDFLSNVVITNGASPSWAETGVSLTAAGKVIGDTQLFATSVVSGPTAVLVNSYTLPREGEAYGMIALTASGAGGAGKIEIATPGAPAGTAGTGPFLFWGTQNVKFRAKARVNIVYPDELETVANEGFGFSFVSHNGTNLRYTGFSAGWGGAALQNWSVHVMEGAGGTKAPNLVAAFAPLDDTWYDLEIIYDSNRVYLKINDELVHSEPAVIDANSLGYLQFVMNSTGSAGAQEYILIDYAKMAISRPRS